MEFRDFKNFHEMLKETVDRRGKNTAYRWFVEAGQTDSVTWTEYYDQVKQVGKSLIALGIKKDDKVNILSYSSYRWVLSDMAMMCIGAVTVGIYQSLLPDDCKYIINHSDAVLVFAEDDIQLQKLFEIRKELSEVRKVVLFNGKCPEDDWVLSFEEFLDLGKDVPDKDFEKRVGAVGSQDAAAIVYTSGTTGVPKGAVLTHDNITFTAQSVGKSVQYYDDDHVFLFLPLAHVFARTCVNTAILSGCTLTFNRSMDTLADDLKAAQPHWFPSVPRTYEKVYSKVISGAEAKGGIALKIFRWACDVGKQVSECKLNNEPIPFLTDLKYKLATRLVFSKIQAALGGRVRWCISGAAPINPDIATFFHGAGILIVEGLGMTENTSFTNLNRFDNYRFGWVGPPGPGIEQKIAEDGEIMFRGRNVMKEYYKMPEETAETLTEDGWQYTGDLGEIDSENFLKVTGRKKELIITAGGKKIPPSAIEGIVATSKHIAQICVIGDRRKYLTALVTLDPDNIAGYARENGISFSSVDDLIGNEKIISLIEEEVAEKNKTLASFETIKKVTIIPEFTIENGLLTPTFKIKKNIAMDRYQDKIDAMYPKE
ncbi:MAG: long-chain fatty acid--CoA ligase [Deltaproteobacteria bacterium]|nr:long-chain fatty acid--CoA ligase [Deltaproteobacteria bacterium]